MKFVKATNHQNIKTVEYEAADGTRLLRSGGDISWRFNNPGNLTASKDISKQPGRIGIGTVSNPNKHDFAIFSSYEDGVNAKKLLLKNKYGNSTIEEMIAIYAPKDDGNDPDDYADHIIKFSGASRNQKISDMDDATFKKVMKAIQIKEGNGKPGKEKWVNTTNIKITNGSQPLANYPFLVTIGACTYDWITNYCGGLPTIAHVQEGMKIEVKEKSTSGKDNVIYSSITGSKTKNIILKKKSSQYVAKTLPDKLQKPRAKSIIDPIEYIIQSGDTLAKISKRFNVTTADIASVNNIKNIDKIYPGQKINIYGNVKGNVDLNEQQPWEQSGVSFPIPSYPSEKDIELKSESSSKKKQTPKPSTNTNKKTKVTQKLESKGGVVSGNGQAHVPISQKEAPWMKTAIAEAAKYKGVDESIIGDSENFHELVNAKFPDANDLIGKSSAWCGSFINYCLQVNGYMMWKDPFRAKSVAKDKVNFKELLDGPVYGCIALLPYSHVTFVYGKDKDNKEKFIGLGGNQGGNNTFGGTIMFSSYQVAGTKFYLPVLYDEINSGSILDEFNVKEINDHFMIDITKKGNGVT